MNKFIYKVLIKNNIILDEDVFYYGWSILKQYFIFFLITIPISIYCGIIFETLSFLAIYIPLRRYIGGFHFNRKYVCTIVSSIVTIFASFVSGKLQCNYMLITLTNLLLITATYLIDPVDHVNKRLSSREKDIYKKKSIKIEIFYFFLVIFLFSFYQFNFINLIFIAECITLISITSAYFKVNRLPI